MKRVTLHTLGCKLNFAETSTIGRTFVARGFEVVDFDQPADVVVLNTCSVTERADREARQVIRRALRTSPDAFVIVTGCYAQLEPEEVASIDGVDVVLGASEKFRLFDLVGDFRKNTYPQIHVSDIGSHTQFHSSFSADVGGRTRAFLKVQDGCDYSCSFCTIPLARGGSRSQPLENVVKQAMFLAEQDYKEIVLTGVNVGCYGEDTGSSLLELLRALENVPGIQRIRMSSIEPNLLSRALVDCVLESEKLCNHFHIPLQSGNDTILKGMRRRYRTSHYREIVEYIRSRDPSAGIGADVIVGFPGETDALFEDSYRFLADLAISYLHVFAYSERPNTPASTFADAVEPAVRSRRSRMLRALGEKKRCAFYSGFIGRTMDVLVEGHPNGMGGFGLTTNYIRVRVNEGIASVNHIVPVLLTRLETDECSGRLVAGTDVLRTTDASPMLSTVLQ